MPFFYIRFVELIKTEKKKVETLKKGKIKKQTWKSLSFIFIAFFFVCVCVCVYFVIVTIEKREEDKMIEVFVGKRNCCTTYKFVCRLLKGEEERKRRGVKNKRFLNERF